MKPVIHKVAHVRHGGYGADLGGDSHCADEFLYAAVTYIRSTLAKIQVQALQGLFQFGRNDAVLVNEPVLLGEKGHTPVHCAGIQIKESELLGDKFCKGAFPRGGISVHCNDNIRYLHMFYLVFFVYLSAISLTLLALVTLSGWEENIFSR